MSIIQSSFKRLLADICELHSIHLDAPVDLPLSWYLVEAPLLDKQLLSYLEGSRVEHPVFPEWLLPLWEAFCINDDAEFLRSLRILLVFCYKAEFAPTTDQLLDAQKAFISVESDVDNWNRNFISMKLGEGHLFRSARSYLSRVISRLSFRDITPCHGPGAVFPSRIPCQKSKFAVLYSQIQQYYPFDQFFCGIWSFWTDVMVNDRSGSIVESDRIDCCLKAVPKDSRGPRLICVHPSEAIWIQQGQRRLLEGAICDSPLTHGHINFHDQGVNGSLALSSSRDRRYVTLDLKEASDRIGCELVRYLFGGLYDIMSCARASHCKLLDGTVIELQKWAPMGNCLTFPVQSLIFYSLVRAGIRCRHGIDCDDIYVFGDDILFPSEFYNGALYGLISAGLVPNMNKTFKHGFFRESCGVDAYKGTDITPYRLKVPGIVSYSDAVSACDLAKRLRLNGYMHCSSFIYSQVRVFMGELLLSNNPEAQGIYEYVVDPTTVLRYGHVRFNRGLQRAECKIVLVQGTNDVPRVDDWYHLQDSLLRLARMGNTLSDRGTEYPVPYGSRLTYGWTELHL